MTKAEIVNEITKKTGTDKLTVLNTIEAFMETVKESLTKEENVYLRGFGSFIVKKRAQKTARNISKNTTIIIPEHNIPAFKLITGLPAFRCGPFAIRLIPRFHQGVKLLIRQLASGNFRHFAACMLHVRLV